MIKICLTRDDGDCDYRTSYDQDGTVKVPIKGNITYFGKIDLNNGQAVNATNTIYLIRTCAGGDPITPLGGYNIFNSPATRINGDNISWDLNWLKFNRVDFESGEQVYYVLKSRSMWKAAASPHLLPMRPRISIPIAACSTRCKSSRCRLFTAAWRQTH